jgi:hypothetical protein
MADIMKISCLLYYFVYSIVKVSMFSVSAICRKRLQSYNKFLNWQNLVLQINVF